MREGILAALDVIEQATGEREVAAIGYCVGGTLLAATLAYMAADRRQAHRQRDLLRHTGRLHRRRRSQGVRRRRAIEGGRGADGRTRLSRRLADGQRLQHAAGRTTSSGRITSTIISRAKSPCRSTSSSGTPNSTRMPAANHKFYLRHCYLQNDLSNGRMELGGKTLDLKKVTIPVYDWRRKEDHIAPAARCSRAPNALAARCAT